ncbi:MAG: uracil-DNA glycosylase [Ilumatobacteraceae bacterium]
MSTDWNPLLSDELQAPYWAELMAFVEAERELGPVYPPRSDVFAALHLTSYAELRVVILGQDPYHGPGQAHGLAFSVGAGVPPPPSLRNVFAELVDDLGCPVPPSGDLSAWASQGVLLLNTSLTVAGGAAGSHQGKGWERFTDRVIATAAAKPERVVFVLWGAAAQKKRPLIDQDRHVVIASPHPSPLSAHRGFLGSKPFSRANAALAEAGRTPIDWCLG